VHLLRADDHDLSSCRQRIEHDQRGRADRQPQHISCHYSQQAPFRRAMSCEPLHREALNSLRTISMALFSCIFKPWRARPCIDCFETGETVSFSSYSGSRGGGSEGISSTAFLSETGVKFPFVELAPGRICTSCGSLGAATVLIAASCCR